MLHYTLFIIHYTLFIIPNGVRLAHKTLEKLSVSSRVPIYIYTTPHPHLQPSLQTELPKGESMEIQKSKLSSSDVVVSEEDSCSMV